MYVLIAGDIKNMICMTIKYYKKFKYLIIFYF